MKSGPSIRQMVMRAPALLGLPAEVRMDERKRKRERERERDREIIDYDFIQH